MLSAELSVSYTHLFIARLYGSVFFVSVLNDGVTYHTANSTLDFPRDSFGERLIGTGLWLARSSSLFSVNYLYISGAI